MKIKEMIYDYLETNHGDLNKMEEFSEFICDYFKKIKEENKHIYYDFKKELDTFTFEIDEDIIEEAILHLERKDGKEGKKWDITDTDGVAKQYGIFEVDGLYDSIEDWMNQKENEEYYCEEDK